ncbi:MAG: peptidylprolyl isomerase [Bacilli bacterium]
MNKRLATLSLVSLLAVGSLTACGEGYDYEEGIMLYLNGEAYTTDELFEESYGIDTSAGIKAIYDVVNEAIIEADIPTTDTMTQIVDNLMEDFYGDCEDKADTNGTTKSEEIENALEDLGFDDVDELEDSYYLEQKQTKAEDEYYSNDRYEEEFIPSFVEETSPYHVKHILVKVDASSSDLYNATISEDDAEDIANVVERLATGEDFGTVAQTKSEDTTSAANFGDAGIMSTKTTFVSEFKYGIYTYDAMFNPEIDDETKETVIDKTFATDENIVSAYQDEIDGKAFGIPYSAVKELDYYADVTTAADGQPVSDAEEYNYPRNILFNNYFNNHSLSFVFLDENTDDSSYYYDSSDYTEAASSGRFQTVSGISDNLQLLDADDTGVYSALQQIDSSKKILCDEEGRPILVTRAGTGTSDSGYQGIHFIVAQKDPFTTTNEELESYYTLDTPSTTSSEDDEDTFVNFVDSTNKDVYTERVESIKTAVKAMDSNFSLRQFEYYLDEAINEHGLRMSDELEEAITKYISTTRATTEESEERAYNENWEDYLYLLQTFDDYAKRIIPVEEGIDAFNNNNIEEFNNNKASAAALKEGM